MRAVVRTWTTTGRLSPWVAGCLALTDPAGQMAAWLPPCLAAGERRLLTVARPLPALLTAPTHRAA